MQAAINTLCAVVLVLLLILVGPPILRLLWRASLPKTRGGRVLGGVAAFLLFLGIGDTLLGSGALAGAYNLIQVGGVSAGRGSTLNFTGTGVSGCSTVGVVTTCTIAAGGSGIANYRQTFTSQTSVALTHNLNTAAILVQCVDSGGIVVIPNSITLTNSNTATVTFAVSTTGACSVNGGGTNGGAIIGTSLEINGSVNSPAKIVGNTQSFIDFWYGGSSKGQIGACTTGPCILDSAGNIGFRIDNGGTRLMTTGGNVNAPKYLTQGNCASIASPAVCTSAAAGRVAINTGAGTTLTVNTTAVAATSEVKVWFDASLGAALGVTCDGTYTPSWVTAKVAATSFTFSIGTNPGANYACFAYEVLN